MGMEPYAKNMEGTRDSGLLGWLGFGRQERRRDDAALRPTDHGQRAREALLARISGFLLDNGLEVTGTNLATAHGIFAGLNPGLLRRVKARLESGRGIDQHWLDREIADAQPTEDTSIEELAKRLDHGLTDFSRSTRNARTATRQYGDALEGHVGRLETVPDPGELITELARYARQMLERSRKAESELKVSEQEAALLQHNLERARRDAEVDFLTGLPNRRAFEKRLKIAMREARTENESLCVAFCDIDHFKAVNDVHGHDAGDRVICVVAETLAKVSGEKCHIARHGGEEFVLLFLGKTAGEALAELDVARTQLAARNLVNRRTQQPFGQVTFSGGIADLFSYPSAREALSAADEALYDAKQGGRNQIRTAKQAA